MHIKCTETVKYDARCTIFKGAIVFTIRCFVYHELVKWACGAPGPSAVSGAAKKQY